VKFILLYWLVRASYIEAMTIEVHSTTNWTKN